MSQTFGVPLANTRNVTIVAHVDHGKTSFADSLLSSNNIISTRMAGKLRFLDSREDEQERGITMESSAVALRFDMNRMSENGESSTSKHLCNVIDTPGHVDFASEVSTASRLCDGALVLVDVWEGVQTQTISVLRQCWIDRLRPLLVINKMDRLITELKLSPTEAYHHLSRLIEQVNAVMGSFFASERMEDDLRWREEREKRLAQRNQQRDGDATPTEGGDGVDGDDAEANGYEEKEDEDLYFAPEKGNVLFASAIDGWAFRLGKFARLYADKLGVKERNLRRALWGDFYLDPKTKRVVGRKKLAGRSLKPLFVQFVLDNIWRVYETLLGDYNPDAVTKIVTALNIRVSPRDLKSKDTRNLLNLIMQQWLPLSTATFQAIVDIIPPPDVAQSQRMPHILHPEQAISLTTAATLPPQSQIEEGLYHCTQSKDAQVVGYVSKMFAVARGDLPEHRVKEMTAEEMRQRGKEEREKRAALAAVAAAEGSSSNEATVGQPLNLANSMSRLNLDNEASATVGTDTSPESEDHSDSGETSEVLLAFSRVFSGTVTRGSKLLAALPKFSPELGFEHPKNKKFLAKVTVRDLYMMMGRELVPVEEVPAGHVCAISGFEGIIHRNATLWAPNAEGLKDDFEKPDGPLVNLSGVVTQASPIVRVALEPENPSDMPKLVKGLKILNQSDPCAEYLVQETGEHVILTAGELHLERCLKDLRERFAKCAIQRSQTIVPFRETAVKGIDMAPPKTVGAVRGTIHNTVFGLVTYTLRAIPLPTEITDFLLAHTGTIAKLISQQRDDVNQDEAAEIDVEAVDGAGDQTQSQAQDQARSLTSQQFWEEFDKVAKKIGGEWSSVVDRIWSFGPKRIGSCLLVDPIGSEHLRLRRRGEMIASAREKGASDNEAVQMTHDAVTQEQIASLPSHLHVDDPSKDGGAVEGAGEEADENTIKAELRLLRDFENSIEAGFQMATFQGPLCSEPVVGMGWIVEKIELHKDAEDDSSRGRMSAVVGALISSVRESCRNSMLDWSPRIKLAMYVCDIQASTDVLGKVYAVVARRRGRIVSEEMKEGTSFFTIRAMLPVVESFGFADEIRKRTSGAASPQLIFAGFETLDLDPFWVPTTIEELEDLGEKADRANVAKLYVDGVRKRKGMFVEKKLVEAAEKQRTLKK